MGRMILNGTVYGAGAKVEANPSGTATDTLQTVDIDGVIYDIQGGGGGGTEITLIQNAEIYSTTEKQIGVWIDGKPLYKKTIDVTGSFSGEMVIGTLDMSSIDKIVKAEMMGLNETTVWRPIPNTQYHSSVDIKAGYFIQTSNGTINLRTGNLTAFSEIVFTMVYTKTTDAAGSGGYQAWGFSPIIYSTEEREVGVWTDNKPLYQKTIVQNNLNWGNVNGVNSSIAHGVSNLDKCVGLKMSCPYMGVASGDIINNGNTGLPLASFRVNTTNVYCVGGNGFYSGSADRYWFITILYTKTTDTAGSGSYNTLGVPNVHYDGNEKVIGTWFGETLYQKSYDINFTSSNNGQDNVIDSTFGDDKLIHQCQINFDGLNQLFTNNTTFNDTLYISNGQLIYYFEKTGSWWNNLNHCIIHIQYTKSTT